MNKWLTISLGAVLGISHIGMIGLLSNRESKLPSLDIPVGPYTSYLAEVSKEGYRISYKANDPKTMYITKDIKKKGGFLGHDRLRNLCTLAGLLRRHLME